MAAEGADEEVEGDCTPRRVVTMTERYIKDRHNSNHGEATGSTAILLLALCMILIHHVLHRQREKNLHKETNEATTTLHH